jgi:hypothetical protein
LIAIIPYSFLFGEANGLWRLFRVLRLPRLFALLDVNVFKRVSSDTHKTRELRISLKTKLSQSWKDKRTLRSNKTAKSLFR